MTSTLIRDSLAFRHLGPGSPPNYDPEKQTLFGIPITHVFPAVSLFDVHSLDHLRTREHIVGGMIRVENAGEKVLGFQDTGSSFLIIGNGEASITVILKICHECHWLDKHHKADCAWALVKEIHRL